MYRLFILLTTITLLLLQTIWTESAAPEKKLQAPPRNLQQEQTVARKKAAFQKGRDLLVRRNVPFDPDELLEPRWRENLRPVLDQMPELRTVEQGDAKLKGVKLAHTLYLPENVQLDGDTVILVHRLVFLGRNIVIRGNHDIHIFTLEETQLADNSSKRKPQTILTKAGTPEISGGHITIDTSGRGRNEWLQSRPWERIAKLQPKRKTLHHATGTIFQNANGQDGADGTQGTQGSIGLSGNPGSNGPNGSCTGNINGSNGNPGGNGSFGGNGGNAGNGNGGQNGGNVSFTAELGQSYTVTAHGGNGGDGGQGGSGGQAGSGANGGSGGNGAACSPCSIGSPNTSSGGQGGNGGIGAIGGDGGDGGNGGNGGNGGTITIQYPTGYNPNNISATANGGIGGSSGAGGSGGQGGSAGLAGQGGNGDRGFACSGSGNTGQSGDPGDSGGSGNSGDAGTAGANGSAGSISISEMGGGIEGYGGTSFCDIDVPPSCSDGVDNDGDMDIDQNDSGCICPSPIVIDTLGNGFDFTTASNGVRFDIAGTGRPLLVAWIQGDDAWLILDRNGNGLVDNGSELFGNFTPQPPSTRPHGFLALAEYDKPQNGGNGDGRVGSADLIFSSLRLWQDVNRNGISETGELHLLSSMDIVGIDLEYRHARRTDQQGNLFRYRAKVYDRIGSGVGRWSWDVFLSSAP